MGEASPPQSQRTEISLPMLHQSQNLFNAHEFLKVEIRPSFLLMCRMPLSSLSTKPHSGKFPCTEISLPGGWGVTEKSSSNAPPPSTLASVSQTRVETTQADAGRNQYPLSGFSAPFSLTTFCSPRTAIFQKKAKKALFEEKKVLFEEKKALLVGLSIIYSGLTSSLVSETIL